MREELIMNNQSTIITLFSSSSTVQYIKDIFSVLSLPRGSIFQFRYQSDYIDPRVRGIFDNNNNLDLKALVAFRSSTSSPDDQCFYVPIRWAKIKSIIQISNGYTVNFEIHGYPIYTPDFRNKSTSFQGINESAKRFFQQMGNNDYAVWGESLAIVNLDDDVDRDSENWYEIVRRLTLLPDYKDYHFLKCSFPYMEKIDNDLGTYEKIECNVENNFTQFIEEKCVYIDIEYYSANYDQSKKRQIDVFVDENILSRAKGLRTTLQSRYGTIKLGLQSKKVTNKTITEVVINTNSSIPDELQTEITFPVVVIKNKIHKILKSIITSIGALLVAMPGIINDSLDVGWNILIAGLGVLVLGINNYWESKE